MQIISNKWVKHLLRFGKTCKMICVLQLLPKLFELMKLFIDLICGIQINNIVFNLPHLTVYLNLNSILSNLTPSLCSQRYDMTI